MMRALFFILVVVGFAGCVTQPTVTRENPERKMQNAEKLLEPIRISKESVVVDARPRFEYTLAHIPRSVSIQWQDYTEAEPAQRGIIQRDVFAAARRLARYGISPNSQVVVVGLGKKGKGEEGRIAWMLAYLGVKDVSFASIDSFKVNYTNIVEDENAQSAPLWVPETIESLNVTREELLFAINKRGVFEPVAFRKGDAPTLYRIIDVRASKDYLGKEGVGARKNIPNMDAVNIPWPEFFTAGLRPQVGFRDHLQSIGLLPEHRIIVLDEDGVSSAAVTMALRALGFSKAGNYSGGLTDLMSGN